MGPFGVAERYRQFLATLHVRDDVSWLPAPVTPSELRYVEEELGYELPRDWVELLAIHNGGRLIDVQRWMPCVERSDDGVLAMRRILEGTIYELSVADPPPNLVLPGPRTLQITTESHVGVLYDLDDQPGRLLYLDVMSRPGVVPLARDLASLLDAQIALAEAGCITVDERHGPYVQGPPDEVRDILVSHNVADVASSGISSWLQWPGAADFSID